MWTQGGKESVGMNRERGMEKHPSPCVKQIASGNLLYDSGSSNQSDNLEGWDGVGGGRKVQEGGNICIPMANSG